MSYRIIFQDKVISLPDGRLLYISRQGCNNDDEGRQKGVFNNIALHTKESFEEFIRKFEDDSYDYGDTFDLKIVSKFCKWKDYSSHLRRLLRRTESFESVLINYVFFYALVIESITHSWSENGNFISKTYSNEEWKNIPYKEKYFSGKSVSVNTKKIRDIKSIVDAIEMNNPIEIHLGKKVI